MSAAAEPAPGAGAEMVWWGWGTAERHAPLPAPTRRLLESALGLSGRVSAPVDPAAVRMRAPALPDGARRALEAAVGGGHVVVAPEARLRHATGRSTVDLLRLRAGDAVDAPDAVVLPAGHGEVLAVLRGCAAHRVAVVPFGGGTSVVGGVEPRREDLAAVIALDLRRLDRLADVDPVSLTATLGPGLRGPLAERLLAAHGLTLGHVPQSWEHATLGGFAASGSAGQASGGYGRFDDMVEALTVATPAGELRLGRAPASAAGPDLRRLLLGSEGALGVITELVLRVRRAPEVSVDEGWHLADFAAGLAATRELAQGDAALPAVLRLSDEAETAVTAATGGRLPPGGCLLIAGYEGTAQAVRRRRRAAAAALRAAGARSLGPGPGRAWRASRFEAPYLRDALLGLGAVADTLETATSWSRLPGLHRAIFDALTAELAARATPGVVLCHLSHAYPSGASLYFTVAAAQAADPVAQWRGIKRAAGDAIVARGATISHHHGVGLDHRDRMVDEVGELGVEVLRAVKRRLDPAGILNPGKLIPAGPR